MNDLKHWAYLPQALTELRIYRGFGKKIDLARSMGVADPSGYSRNKLGKYEAGHVPPPIPELDAIMTALEVDLPMLATALEAVKNGVPLVSALVKAELGDEPQGRPALPQRLSADAAVKDLTEKMKSDPALRSALGRLMELTGDDAGEDLEESTQ